MSQFPQETTVGAGRRSSKVRSNSKAPSPLGRSRERGLLNAVGEKGRVCDTVRFLRISSTGYKMNKYNKTRSAALSTSSVTKKLRKTWKRRSPDNVGGIEKDLVKLASTENPDVLKQ